MQWQYLSWKVSGWGEVTLELGFCTNLSDSGVLWGLWAADIPSSLALKAPPDRALGSTLAVFFLLSVISVGMEWPDFLSSRPSRVCPCWKAPAVRNKLASCCISPSFHFLTAQMQQTWSFPKQWPIVWFGWFSYLLNIMLFHLRGNRLDTSTRVGLALCCCFNRQIKAAIFPA